MRVSGLWRNAAGLLAIVSLVIAGPAAAQAEPRPAIWLLEDADTKIYLFGTIHVLPPGLRWRSAVLDRIIAQAGELVVESYVAPGQEAESEAAQLFFTDDAEPILSRVPEERRAALRAAIEAGPVPVEAYDRMHTWAVALVLGLAGLLGDYGIEEGGAVTGVESVLEEEFRTARKPIGSVEDPAGVLRDLNALPAAMQNALLLQAIGEMEVAAEGVDVSLPAWLAGKAERMTIPAGAFPAQMHDVLLRKRNTAWVAWLEARLARPGITLFAVGAGHLAGPDSVQRLLAARGLQARRID